MNSTAMNPKPLSRKLDDPVYILEQEIGTLFPNRSIKRVLLIAPPDADRTMFDYATGKRGRYWNFPPTASGSSLASC